MPRKRAGVLADHPRDQAFDRERYALRGITGSSALKT
jgi:hypothetical protein